MRLQVKSVLVLGLLALAATPTAASAQQNCRDTPEGRICETQQPIVNGAIVDAPTQQALGLVTITNPNGSCSGMMLNPRWILTARHCVVAINPPTSNFYKLLDPAQITVTATWSNGTGFPRRMREFDLNLGRLGLGGTQDPLDEVLIYLGAADFGSDVPITRPYRVAPPLGWGPLRAVVAGRLTTGDRPVQYGRGFGTLASGTFLGPTPNAVPASGLGVYRMAPFAPSNISLDGYDFVLNGSNQVGHGGDSGGPTLMTSGGAIYVTGVQSTCSVAPGGYVPGAPVPAGATNPGWAWATAISSCHYASIERFQQETDAATREKPSDSPAVRAVAVIARAAMD